MSVTMQQNKVNKHRKNIADLKKKLADEGRRKSSKNREIGRISRSITKRTSESSLRSKERQIERKSSEIVRILKKEADLEKKIADETSNLHKAETTLEKEKKRERKRISEIEKRRAQEQENYQDSVLTNLHQTYETDKAIPDTESIEYDAFICHASEDKKDFVEPLAKALQDAGYKIWYDKFSLKVGDSLRRSIDNGLKNSRHGIVVLSNDFFRKGWPQYELDGLVSKQMEGRKVILPI